MLMKGGHFLIPRLRTPPNSSGLGLTLDRGGEGTKGSWPGQLGKMIWSTSLDGGGCLPEAGTRWHWDGGRWEL